MSPMSATTKIRLTLVNHDPDEERISHMSNSADSAGRRVAAEVTISMVGYSSTGSDDDMHWCMDHILSEQSELYYEGIWRGASTAVLGRVNWEGFTSVWPGLTEDPTSSARTRELGRWLAIVEKVVFTKTLRQADLDKLNGATGSYPPHGQPRRGTHHRTCTGRLHRGSGGKPSASCRP